MPARKTHVQFLKELEVKNTHFTSKELFIIGRYKNKDTFILVKNKYGYGKMTPHSLLTGANLTIRGALHPKQYLISQFNFKYNYRYKYLFNKFKSAKTKISIRCVKHGVFRKTPNKHLSGEGCPICKFKQIQYINKYSDTGWGLTSWVKSASTSNSFDAFKLYIVLLESSDELFYKLGRTYTIVSSRMKLIPYKFKTLYLIEGDAEYIIRLEAKLKLDNKINRYLPKLDFAGKTECYKILDINKIRYLSQR